MSRGKRGTEGFRGGVPNDARILDVLQRATAPLKGKELARRLRVGTHMYRPFRDRLRALAQAGRIVRIGNRYSAASARVEVEGVVEWIRSGDAFLVRADGPDVFIAAVDLMGALAGDRVRAEVEADPRGRKPRGEVLQIIQRAARPVVGVLRVDRRGARVVPRRGKGPPLAIPRDFVGPASSGDLVEAEIVAYGARRRSPVGRVRRVLGRQGDPRADSRALRAEWGLPEGFPPDVEAAAREAAERPVALDPGRVDCRHLHVITIDPADARDHDDAVSVVRREDGVLEVGIHIADVSYYVEPGTNLDREAFARGTSVYLVDGVVPMLPESLSADACSLREGEDRRTVTLFAGLGDNAEVRDFRLERTLIRSASSLDYGAAQAILDASEAASEARSEADPGGPGSAVSHATRWTVETLHRLAEILRKRRQERGSLDLDLPEVKVEVADDGTPIRILRRERFDSHRLIEEFMVLANELVADEALRRDLPVLFRAHDAPDPDRTERLADLVSAFGHEIRTPVTARRLQELLDRSRGTAEEPVIHMAVLRSLKRAEYADDRAGHFGLASRAYAHFTSPIRRYPDLHLHRAVVAGILAGLPVPPVAGDVDLEEAGHALSAAERRADSAQRDSTDLAKVELMESRLGDVFAGTISSVHRFGFFVLLDEMHVEGLVHVETLDDDYYEIHERSASLIGANLGRVFRLGDRVRVQVARVDRSERQVDFMLLGNAEPSGAEDSMRLRGDRSKGRPDPLTGRPGS